MTAADTALAFARTCLHWSDARILNGTVSVFEGHGRGRFKHTDLNAIMAHVTEWCDREEARTGQYVTANVSYAAKRHIAHVFIGNKPRVFTAEAAEPCQAIMEACVAASVEVISRFFPERHSRPDFLDLRPSIA